MPNRNLGKEATSLLPAQTTPRNLIADSGAEGRYLVGSMQFDVPLKIFKHTALPLRLTSFIFDHLTS